MSKTKFSFEALHSARAAAEQADAALTTAETQAEQAEQAVTAASNDDGRMPPEKLLVRIEGAERAVRIRQIELRRATTARAKAVAEFYQLLKEANAPLVAALRAKADEGRETVRAALTAQLGASVAASGNFLQTLESAEAVAEPTGAWRRLEMSLNYDGGAAEPTNGLIQNTFDAERFL